MSKRDRRMAKRADAARFLEEHSDPVMRMLAEVVEDLAEENENLTIFAQDLNLAIELGWRLDKLFHSNDPLLEALDGPIGALIAGIAIAIWRGVARAEKLRGAKLERLEKRLKERGPKMATRARRHLERRIKRLSS